MLSLEEKRLKETFQAFKYMKTVTNRTEIKEEQKHYLFLATQSGFICIFLIATFKTKWTLEGIQSKRWSSPCHETFQNRLVNTSQVQVFST